MSERIAISKIRTDGGTQPRAGLDSDTVEQYTAAVKTKAKFPPVVVYYDGAAYWLADGFHRLQAHKNAQKRAILADIRQGNLREAILHSAGANATHGLRRSNDDKRRAVMCLLDDPEWSQWSDRAIAKRCNVSHVFVAKLRPDTGNVTTMERKFTHHKTGETSTMKLSKQAAKIIDNWLRQHFNTEDPANLASHARYAQKGATLDSLCQFLALNGVNSASTAVVAVLTDLAAQYQGQVPKTEPAATTSYSEYLDLTSTLVYSAARLSDAARGALRDSLGLAALAAADNAKTHNEYVVIKQFWGAIKEFLS